MGFWTGKGYCKNPLLFTHDTSCRGIDLLLYPRPLFMTAKLSGCFRYGSELQNNQKLTLNPIYKIYLEIDECLSLHNLKSRVWKYIEAIRRHGARCGLWSMQKLKSSRKIRSYLAQWKTWWSNESDPASHIDTLSMCSEFPLTNLHTLQNAEFSLTNLYILQAQSRFFSPFFLPHHAQLSSLWRKYSPQNASRDSLPLPTLLTANT